MKKWMLAKDKKGFFLPGEISLCKGCWCMTHTVYKYPVPGQDALKEEAKCGKCGAKK